tara:strand:- start:395 stop:1555 length:1161 start_codon:yes stop_codon:yes gene_type:complete
MKICIVGGGTSGWWCAAYMEKFLDAEITLIESDNIPIIGVGESSLPQIKTFFDAIGIEEKVWMKECHAVYKYGNIKTGWDKMNGEPFTFTFWHNDNNKFDKWYHNKTDFNQLYEKGAWGSVAYHLDAEEASVLIKNHCKNVIHKIDTLTELPKGYDLYVDCTGFSRKFIKDKSETIFDDHLVNSAWVCPFKQDGNIENYTKSIAREYGWQFIIDLQNKVGSGYVFCDKYLTDNEARFYFKEYTKELTPLKEPKLIKWKPNILTNAWCDDVVAVGLSGGFIDPLEANALYMTVYSITSLVECINRNLGQEVYNRNMRKVWKGNSDFILHHYKLTKRYDTEFWRFYRSFDVRKSLWDNYRQKNNKRTNLFSDAIWATLGVYFDEFTFY